MHGNTACIWTQISVFCESLSSLSSYHNNKFLQKPRLKNRFSFILSFPRLTRQTPDIYSDWSHKMRASSHSTIQFYENKSTSSILLHVARTAQQTAIRPCLHIWLSFANASSSDTSRKHRNVQFCQRGSMGWRLPMSVLWLARTDPKSMVFGEPC
jgi:hypothetical protein